MTFSGALTLTDLDDFLAPSQACILPVRQTNKVAKQEDGVNAVDTEIHIDSQNNYYEVAIASTSKPSTSLSIDQPSSSSSAAGPSVTLDGAPAPGGAAPEVGIEVPSKAGQGQGQQLQKAEISLNDCLACSGCVTSTESMLITLQSHLEVQQYITAHTTLTCSSTTPCAVPATPDCGPSTPSASCSTSHPSDPRLGVLSISPQTLASLAASFFPSSSPAEGGVEHKVLQRLLRRIRAFMAREDNGGWAVWDTTFARHLSLLEHVKEFKQRRAVGKGKGKAFPLGGVEGGEEGKTTGLKGLGLPMLASACPGWVCYAEKAHGDLLGFVGATRSSQGVMGGLVKGWWAEGRGKSPSEVYHVTVMPCYDKKLEASRSDFYNSIHQTRDVDCVLTTGELDLLLKERGFNPHTSVSGEDDFAPPPTDCPFLELLNHPGTSSGSYLHTLLTALADECPNPTKLITRPIRNSDDHVEYVLEDQVTREVIFKGAKCYGFRNLQNLVRKVGRETGIKSGRAAGAAKLTAAVVARRRAGRATRGAAAGSGLDTPGTTDSESQAEESTLDYVEVMACPGGCVNGGGQMKPTAEDKKPVETNTDEEGFKRVWELEGVDPAKPQVDESMRWSTKSWVAQVEQVYWAGLPTPPPSPPASDDAKRDGLFVSADAKIPLADEMAKRVIVEVCKPASGAYQEEMDSEAEARREEFLRTRYRKVESDITSLAAVKW